MRHIANLDRANAIDVVIKTLERVTVQIDEIAGYVKAHPITAVIGL